MKLKPLYKTFEKDFIDFWSLLGVPFGASSSDVCYQYMKHLKTQSMDEKIDEFYVGYKLLKDKSFEKVYKDTQSLSKTYDAGFFLDSIDHYQDSYSLNGFHTPVIPMNKLEFKDDVQNVVLVSTGGFSPVHEGHLHTLEIAKKRLEEKGYHVAGGYLSPSHDHYVSTKDNGKAHNPALNRIRLCNEATIDSTWIMTSPFESVYTATSVNYTDALYTIKQQINKTFHKNVIIGYVFGGDNAPFIRAFQDEDIAICVSRQHERENIFQEDNIDHLNSVFIKENPFADISSTKKRNMIANAYKDVSKSINSNNYLIRDDFYFYKDVPNKFSPMTELLHLFEKTMPEFSFSVIDVKDQIEKAQIDLCNEKQTTLSLDVYVKGDCNMEISRVFNISDSQTRAKGFTIRPEMKEKGYTQPILERTNYTLIEDDIASGQTLEYIKSLIPKDGTITNQIILSKYSELVNKEHYDIVDLRDFIINAPHGGLVVEHRDKQFRAPYIAPFVDLVSRASIPPEKAIDFSIGVINLNIAFYKKLKENNIEISLNSQTVSLFEHCQFRYKKYKAIDAIIFYCYNQLEFLMDCCYE